MKSQIRNRKTNRKHTRKTTKLRKNKKQHTKSKGKSMTKPINKSIINTSVKINHPSPSYLMKGGEIDDIMPYLKPYGILDPDGNYPNPLNGNTSYSEKYYEFSPKWREYPIYEDKTALFNKIHKNQALLIVAGTGVGKTVLVPKFLLHYFDYQGNIAITIPKRGIVAYAGGGAAMMLDVKLGREVGYIHGGDKKHYDYTRTKMGFMTEGILLAQMTGSDPDLIKYSGVIIDEAHERSTNVDVLLLLLKKLCLRRPEFKLIIMSATVSEKVFIDFYNVPGIVFDVYRIGQGTLYPVEHKFEKDHINQNKAQDMIIDKVKNLVNTTDKGHIIAFVSTKSEADKICKAIEPDLANNKMKPICIKMYSGVPKKDKDMVEGSTDELYEKGYGRKIVSATNAVESSMTVPDTVYVVDSGLEYSVTFDPVRVANVRKKQYASQASIKQRCGRTGRTNPGICYRMYAKGQWNHFEEYSESSIQSENFTSKMLDILGMKLTGNLKNALALVQEMIEPPNKNLLKHAINNLYYLALMYKDGYLTSVGKAVRKFSKIPPELALVILASTSFDCVHEVVVISAMMANGSLDQWVSEPDDKSKFRKRSDYIADIKRWSSMYYNYGDPFVLLAIYQEYIQQPSSGKARSDWCRKHGVNYTSMRNIDEPNKGTIDEIYKTLDQLTYYPQMFDEPEPKPITQIKSKYRSLTQVGDKYGSSNYNKYDNYDNYNKYDKYASGQYGGKLTKKSFTQFGGRGKKPAKKPKVDIAQKDRDNKEVFAKKIFKEYYMPNNGTLPRKPKVEYLEDKILSCLYYGLHRNMGCYIVGKKYKTKVSTVDGSMKGSIFDILNDLNPPEICLYYQLDISENEFGKDSASYQIVTKIDEDIMGEFL